MSERNNSLSFSSTCAMPTKPVAAERKPNKATGTRSLKLVALQNGVTNCSQGNALGCMLSTTGTWIAKHCIAVQCSGISNSHTEHIEHYLYFEHYRFVDLLNS
jgi:hypothetical protein